MFFYISGGVGDSTVGMVLIFFYLLEKNYKAQFFQHSNFLSSCHLPQLRATITKIVDQKLFLGEKNYILVQEICKFDKQNMMICFFFMKIPLNN